MNEVVEETVAAVKDNAERLGLTWRLSNATVAVGDSPGLVMVVMDGDSDPIGAVSLIGALGFGARVKVLQVDAATNFVTARLGVAVPSNVESFNELEGSDTTTSAAYVDLAAPSSVTFTKRNVDTKILCQLNVVVFAAADTARADFAIAANGVDHDIISCFISNIAVNESVSGVVELPDIPTGVHTIQVRWRRGSGAGTLTIGSPNRISLMAMEVG